MDFSRILNAGLDDLFGVVVFIVIVAVNIIKFVKKGSRPERPKDLSGSQQESSQDELRSFLESLSGVQQPKPQYVTPTPPAPPPAPVQVASAKKTVHTSRPPAKPVKRVATIVDTTTENHTNIIRNAVGNDLVSKKSLRKAIILREIIGPPLALQSKF